MVGAIAFLLYALARLTGDSWLVFAAAAVGACIVVDFILVSYGPPLKVTFYAPRRTSVGSIAQFGFTMKNGRRWPLSAVEVYAEHPGFERGTGVIVDIHPGRLGQLAIDVQATTRGVYRECGEFGASVTGPLGLFSQRTRSVIHSSVIVQPRCAPPLSLLDAAPGSVGRPSGRQGSGIEPHALRPWRPGDNVHAVHWRSTARAGEPVVLQRESELTTALLIVAGPATPGSTWESLVASAAATAVSALRLGITPTLIGSGADEAVVTPLSATAALDWFAALPVTSMPTDVTAHAVARHVAEGATVLWLSTEAPPAALAQSVRRVDA
jgi:uncharacterized protein (DUF58 family)